MATAHLQLQLIAVVHPAPAALTGMDRLMDIPFSFTEDRDLLIALEAGCTVAEIAIDLGRPAAHVNARIREMLKDKDYAPLLRRMARGSRS